MTKEKGNDNKSDEEALFRQSVGPVRKLEQRKAHHQAQKPAPRAALRRREDAEVLAESLTMPADGADVETGEELLHRRPEISERVFRKLRRGQYSVRAEIDLHGLTTAEALPELRDFIAHCVKHRLQCVRVVHGKGIGSGRRGPVLKNKVNVWLRQWDAVLAFCSTPPKDGGTGAVYVLLRR